MANDATVITIDPPIENKTAIRVAGLFVSLPMFLPIRIIIPDAKSSGKVLCFDRGKELVHGMFRRQIPTDKDNDGYNSAQNKSNHEELIALRGAGSVVGGCVQEGHCKGILLQSNPFLIRHRRADECSLQAVNFPVDKSGAHLKKHLSCFILQAI